MKLSIFKTRKTAVIVLGLALLTGLGIVLNRAGYLSAAQLTSLLTELGCWALPAYFLLFVIGGVVQIPGLFFVIAARLAFGPTLGFVAAYVGALLASSAGFALARALRGSSSRALRLPLQWAQRMLESAEKRPVVSVATLRLVFFLSPPVNLGLGFSSVPFPQYVLGSAIGLMLPIALVTFATGLF
jgi:uncharacterized membrane protein YdjX (TVP38/TMEM64 family)